MNDKEKTLFLLEKVRELVEEDRVVNYIDLSVVLSSIVWLENDERFVILMDHLATFSAAITMNVGAMDYSVLSEIKQAVRKKLSPVE